MIQIKILDEKKNPILKRIDLMLAIDHNGQSTPKTNEIVKKMVEKFKSSPEKIEIVYTFSQKGNAKSKVKARIWEDKAPEKKGKKRKKVEKPEEKPNEEVKPQEEKKTEKTEEQKPKEEQSKGEEKK